MTAPTRAEANLVWLGRFTDPAEDGWLEVIDVVRPSELGYFDRKSTLGEPTASSDEYISEWLQGDFKGGIGVEDLAVTTDTDRIWYSVLDTRSPIKNVLPPLVTNDAPAGANADATCYPLGDVYDDTTGRVQTFYAAFDTEVYGYSETTASWYSKAATDLSADPVGPGTPFRGTGSDVLLFVPCGSTGYATIVETSAGSATVANVAASATAPGAVDFALWANHLYAVDTGGLIWQTVDGATWTEVTDSVGTETRLDRSREPKKLVRGVDPAGNSVLYLVTDMDVWTVDTAGGHLNLTNVVDFVHPDFGLDAITWRPGEDLWVAYGTDVVRLTSAGVIVPLSGPARNDGLPAALAQGKIVSFAGTNDTLYALLKGSPGADSEETTVTELGTYYDDPSYVPDAASYAALLGWTGQGWHGLWQSADDSVSPSWSVISRVPNGHRLWWGMDDATAYRLKLRTGFYNPRQGALGGFDEYAATGSLESPRFDAGMLGYRKKISHASVFMEHATQFERIEVAYRTDNDLADTIVDPGYPHALGSATTQGETILAFDPNGDGFNEGQHFGWVQYQVTAHRRTGATNPERHTPIWQSLITHFRKIPQNTTSHSIRITLNPEKHIGRSAAQTRQRLRELIEADEYLVLVMGDDRLRVDIAGVSGDRDLGDESGNLTLSLIELHDDA